MRPMVVKKQRSNSARTAPSAFRLGAGLPALALLAVATATGCGNNRLPPNPVPRPEFSEPLPKWYPEAPWTAQQGVSRVLIEGRIVFDTDRATIRGGESERVLTTLLRFLEEHKEVTIMRIEGHTDSTAGREYNMALSAKRALAVCDWLVDHNIDNTRLLAVGFGESRPIGPNDIAAGRQANRRTEFHVAEINGRLFLGRDPTSGGFALIVRSREDRKREKEVVVVREQPKRSVFRAEYNVIKPIELPKDRPITATPPSELPPTLQLPKDKKD